MKTAGKTPKGRVPGEFCNSIKAFSGLVGETIESSCSAKEEKK